MCLMTSKTFSVFIFLSLGSCAESRLRKGEHTGTVQADCNFPVENAATSTCDYDAILTATGCEKSTFWSHLGVDTLEDAEAEVRELCQDAFAASEIFPFEKVTNKGRQFDLEFFNGGGKLNNNEIESQTLIEQTERLRAVAENVLSSKIISWPDDLPSLNQADSCSSQVATCCWVADKFDVGEGTCESSTGCIDEEPLDNTDVCSVDMSKSTRASRVRRGLALYPGDSEGAVNCHGFVWSEGDEAFKGNALFHLAMQKGFMQNGYVRNVPGAPMCGCIENMPVVSKAGCSKTISYQTWKLSLEDDRLKLVLVDLKLAFEDCDEDLADHYAGRFGTSVDSYITGECDDSYAASAAGYRRASRTWTPIIGTEDLQHDQTITEEKLRSIVNADPDHLKIIRRRCKNCVTSHRDIYYKRLTPIPDDVNLINILTEYWYQMDGNMWHTDFEIYSLYEDAVESKNAWEFCNFDDKNVGFPRDCGPDHHIGGQWNTIPGPLLGSSNQYGKRHVAFYVED